MSDEGLILPTVKSIHSNELVRSSFPSKEGKRLDFDVEDCYYVIFFMFIGVLSRIIRIQYPRNVVFQEDLYGKELNHYLNGEFFNDGPPLSGLILSGIARFAGYAHEYSFEQGERYESMFYVMLRLISGVFGGICVPLMYCYMRMTSSRMASVAAALLIAGDPMLIVQDRFYMGESIRRFFFLLSLLCFTAFDVFGSFWKFIITGVSIGLAAASGHSSVCLIVLLWKEWRLLFVVLPVYFTAYSLHFSMFPRSEKRISFLDYFVKTPVYNSTDIWMDQNRKIICETSIMTAVPIFLVALLNTFSFVESRKRKSLLASLTIIYWSSLIVFKSCDLSFMIGVVQMCIFLDKTRNNIKGFSFYLVIMIAIVNYMLSNPVAYGKRLTLT